MFVSRWVITPWWLSGSWRSFLYSSSVYSYHLFLISSASVRSIPLLLFIVPIFAWHVPLVSLIFLKRSLVFPILLFCSISLHWLLRKAFLSLLAVVLCLQFALSHAHGRTRVESFYLLVGAKFRLKLKKVGKTTRPFRYDLNQIPYGYTVEVTNRFKGLDLIDRVPDELWMEVCDIVQETGIKTIPKKKKCKKSKMIVWGGLTNSCEKQRRKGKRYPFECRIPKNSKER